MRGVAVTALAALSLVGCRPYDGYAQVVAIGRALAEWKGTADSAGYTQQTDHAGCFARRLPDVETVDADPLGHRLTVKFKSGWRAAVLPVHDGIRPDATPGISSLGPSPCL
jgi:hypothetical protein